jgi:hypothetical protein
VGDARAIALTAPDVRTARTILLTAIVAHALGWLLPVVREYRGWQAFRVALSPLWPYERFRIEPGLTLVLSVASALTNVLFVVLVAMLLGGGARRARAVLSAAAGATLLDLHWPLTMGAERAALESGYFVWVTSFALLAFAAFLVLRDRR